MGNKYHHQQQQQPIATGVRIKGLDYHRHTEFLVDIQSNDPAGGSETETTKALFESCTGTATPAAGGGSD